MAVLALTARRGATPLFPAGFLYLQMAGLKVIIFRAKLLPAAREAVPAAKIMQTLTPRQKAMATQKRPLAAAIFLIHTATAAAAGVPMAVLAAPDITAAQAVLTAATAVRGHRAAQTAVLAGVITAARVATVHHPAITGLQLPAMAPAAARVIAAAQVQLAPAIRAYALFAYQHKEVLWVSMQ